MKVKDKKIKITNIIVAFVSSYEFINQVEDTFFIASLVNNELFFHFCKFTRLKLKCLSLFV